MAPLLACPAPGGFPTPSSLEPQGLAAAREQKLQTVAFERVFLALAFSSSRPYHNPMGAWLGAECGPFFWLETMAYHRKLPMKTLSHSLV